MRKQSSAQSLRGSSVSVELTDILEGVEISRRLFYLHKNSDKVLVIGQGEIPGRPMERLLIRATKTQHCSAYG